MVHVVSSQESIPMTSNSVTFCHFHRLMLFFSNLSNESKCVYLRATPFSPLKRKFPCLFNLVLLYSIHC